MNLRAVLPTLISTLAMTACVIPGGESNNGANENNTTATNNTSANNTTANNNTSNAETPPPGDCEPRLNFCDASNPVVVFRCDGAGTSSRVLEECEEGFACGIEDGVATCVMGDIDDAGMCTPTGTLTTCVKDIAKEGGGNYPEGLERRLSCTETVTEICDPGLYCWANDTSNPDSEVSCQTTVLDPENKKFGAMSCPLVQHFEYKTSLEADCRCGTNEVPLHGVDMCSFISTGVSEREAIVGERLEGEARNRFGSGPSMAGVFNTQYNGGFIDQEARKLIVANSWNGSDDTKGVIFSIDLDNGDREVISGQYPTDAGVQEVGDGPSFTYAIDVKPGPDGAYYVFTDSQQTADATIYRVDPATGNRTIIWDAPDSTTTWEEARDSPFGQCIDGYGTGVVQYSQLGFAIDEQGRYYIGYANVQRDGRGIVRISADGSECEYITATGNRQDGMTKGSGGDLGGFVQGFTFHDGKLWAFTTQPKKLWSIDVETGNRTEEMEALSAGALGERWIIWDEGRQIMWTVGLLGTITIVGVDLEEKKAYHAKTDCGQVDWLPMCLGGPGSIINQNLGGAWLDESTGNLFFVQKGDGIIEYEVDTGNSVIRSR
ncbi:MAG: hypothetical protein VYE40_17685 [Myxococcota bacterium]|nr:hypothetical protein [Myxococcota bacterium]